MANAKTLVLWDLNGKIKATLYCSHPSAFNCTRVPDQMGMIAVKVSCNENFDASRDYLIRELSKNGQVETQLICGTMPKWAGGTIASGRTVLDSFAETSRLLEKYPATTQTDMETRRHNGISNEVTVS